MRIIILAIVFCFNANAVLESNENSNNPALYMASQQDSQWFAYRVKVQENTRSMCCWDRSHKNNAQCHLQKQSYGFGNTDDASITENISIYVKLNLGKLDRILTVGDHCEVITGNEHVNWLKGVSQSDSIEWLESAIDTENEDSGPNALYALALHKDDQASDALYRMANAQNEQVAKNAVFWLGESRNDGFGFLSKLYQELPKGKVRQQINFALSLSSDVKSIDFLKKIAVNDTSAEQRADALFWLAHVSPEQAKNIALNVLKDSDDENTINHAVFSLTQLSDENDDALFEVVKGAYSQMVKKQALFWLSQSDNPETISLLYDML